MLSINRTVELKSSIEWLKLSFNIFREKPLNFIVLSLFNLLLGITPIFGAFLGPLFIAKFALLTKQIEQRETVLFSSIFDGFFNNKAVVQLAFINFGISVVLLILQYFAENYFKERGLDFSNLSIGSMFLLFLPVLILQLAMWLSPLICLYNEDISPYQAMLLSLKACGYNVATLFLYTLLCIFFSALAILPLLLGFLIWLPVLNIATYFIYKDVFVRKAIA